MRRVRSREGRPQSHRVSKSRLSNGEVEEAGQVDEEAVGEVLGLVEDDDGGGAAIIDEVDQGLLDVGPELGAAVGGADAQLLGQGAVQVQGGHGGVAQIQDLEVRPRQQGAVMTEAGGLADAGFGAKDPHAGVLGEAVEGPLQAAVARALVEEGLAPCVFGERVMSEAEALSVQGQSSESGSVSSSSWMGIEPAREPTGRARS